VDLQALINSQAPHGRLELPPGEFFGQVVIDRSVTVVGLDKSTWIGSRIAPTIRITVAGVTLKKLMVEVTGGEGAVAIEAFPGTNTILEDVVVRGKIIGVPVENIRYTTPVEEEKTRKVCFEPPPPLDIDTSGHVATSSSQPSPSPEYQPPAPSATHPSWLPWTIVAALLVSLLALLVFQHVRDSELAKSQESQRQKQEKEQALAHEKKAEQEEKERLESERQKKEQARAKLRELERQKPEAESRERARFEGQDAREGWLGLKMDDVGACDTRLKGRASISGALAYLVVPGGPAWTAGIRDMDMILKFNDVPVDSANHLRAQVKGSAPGTTVRLEIYRKRDQPTFHVGAEVGKQETILTTLRGRAERGDPVAQYGIWWLNEKARSYQEAQKENRDAQWLHDVYEHIEELLLAIEVEGRPEELRWLRKAADQGLAEAQYELGMSYQFGNEILAKKGAESLKWLRKAAEQGHRESQYRLGQNLANGDGVPRNFAEAAKWYRMAAEGGDPMAQNNLGLMYFNGQGVAVDYPEAAKLFSLGAAGCCAWAQVHLGRCYADGYGVPRNRDQAIKWYREAAQNLTMFYQDAAKEAKKRLKRMGISQ